MGIEHILARIARIADLIELDTKEVTIRQRAAELKALVVLADKEFAIQETLFEDEDQ